MVGVALASAISQCVSAALILHALTKVEDCYALDFKAVQLDPAMTKSILALGLPAGFQNAIFAIANLFIQAGVNSFDSLMVKGNSAAANADNMIYDAMAAFYMACASFMSQNYGAGKIDRCKKTMFLCLIEDFIASAVAIALVLLTGKYILAIFNSDPEVIAIGYTRLLFLFGSYIFTLTYEILSGYLRGFGISLAPAILTLFGVCGMRIFWIKAIFPMHRTFQSILLAYPISLVTTAVLIFIALLIYRPSRRFAAHAAETPQT